MYFLALIRGLWRHAHRAETLTENDHYTVAFGQGDWTCTLAIFTGTTNDSMKGLDGNMIQPTNKKLEIDCLHSRPLEEWGDCRGEGVLQ